MNQNYLMRKIQLTPQEEELEATEINWDTTLEDNGSRKEKDA